MKSGQEAVINYYAGIQEWQRSEKINRRARKEDEADAELTRVYERARAKPSAVA
jgi:hypothetical protein